MRDISRRDAISKMALGTAAVAVGLSSSGISGNNLFDAAKQASSAASVVAPAFRGQHQPRPLPFDPAKLKGLSEKLIRSHWENNYGGAVKALSRKRLTPSVAAQAG